MEILAVVNQKGGVGKTTSVINIGACLAELGKKVLLIDLDSQGNLTQGVGVTEYSVTMHDCLVRNIPLTEAIVKTEFNFDIIPANINLANAEGELSNIKGKETVLKQLFNNAKLNYDYVLIDAKPALDTLIVNALTASTHVLIPMETSAFAFQGLAQLIRIIKLVQKGLNPGLKVKGVFLVRANTRTTLTADFITELKEIFGDKLFSTVLYQSIAVPKSQIAGQPVNFFDRTSRAYKEFKALSMEVIGNEKAK
jgi:chromosome partitioning protein